MPLGPWARFGADRRPTDGHERGTGHRGPPATHLGADTVDRRGLVAWRGAKGVGWLSSVGVCAGRHGVAPVGWAGRGVRPASDRLGSGCGRRARRTLPRGGDPRTCGVYCSTAGLAGEYPCLDGCDWCRTWPGGWPGGLRKCVCRSPEGSDACGRGWPSRAEPVLVHRCPIPVSRLRIGTMPDSRRMHRGDGVERFPLPAGRDYGRSWIATSGRTRRGNPETRCYFRDLQLVRAPKQQRPPAPVTIQEFGPARGVCRNFRRGEAR